MATQLLLFDCPFGGCEDGYRACLEQDLDEDDGGDPEELELLEALQPGAGLMFARGRARRVETVPIPIDDYQPLNNPEQLGATS